MKGEDDGESEWHDSAMILGAEVGVTDEGSHARQNVPPWSICT